MKCSQCQHENPPGSVFCLECGGRLAAACASCGAELPDGSKFCNKCGTPVAPEAATQLRFASPESYTPKHLAEKILTSKSALEGERKQVTVLFCDIAGSTSLAERLGPEPMHAMLNRFFELALQEVHRYEGTINQFLGDGFMALFGAPVAHEDHARRAALAAWSLSRALHERDPDLAVRMGLNTGFVVVGSIGDNLRMDYTAVGDTTNLAARLEQLAEPGTVVVSEAMSRLVAGYVRVEALAPVRVKGKAEPVAAYRVLGLTPRRSPLEAREDRALSRFAGREREITTLLDLIAQVEGGQGQSAGVVGEPGVGKSRLMYEFRHRLVGRRVTYLEGRCLSYGSAIPYLPVLDIVRSNCGIAEADAPESIADKVRMALQEIGMDADAHAPYLLHLLGVKEGTESLEVLSTEGIRTRTFETLRQMCLQGSQHRPLIFVVEDLHWIDTTSEEFLVSLVESLPGAPILLLTSYRPGYRPAWIEKSYATQLALRPLSSPDSLNVVHSVAGHETLPDHLARLILDKAEGNPFFLEELTRVAVEGRDLQSPVTVPDTIQAVLMARIDRLADAPKRLLQAAAVLGREFSLHLLEAIWEGPTAFDPHLRELRRLEFLYERSGIDEPVYVFKHALTQEVAYAGLLSPRRQGLHAAAGRAIEALYAGRLEQIYDRLAHHYSKTADAAKAVEYLSRFAEKAAKAHAHIEAVTALQEALAHAEQIAVEERDRTAVSLVLRAAESLHYLGRRQEIVDLMVGHQERLDRLQEPTLAGPFYFRLGFTYSFLGNREQAGKNVMRAFASAMESNDQVTMGRASILAAFERAWSAQPTEAIELGQRAVSLLDAAGERWWLGYAYHVLAWCYYASEDHERALNASARVNAIGEAIGDQRLQTNAAQVAGAIYSMVAEWDAGIETLQRALEQSPDAFETALILGFLGAAHCGKGDLTQAVPLLEKAVQQASQYRSRQVQAWFRWFLAQACVSTGRLDVARELANEALELSTETRFLLGMAGAQRTLGYIGQARGDLVEAEARLRESLDTLSPTGSRSWPAQIHLDLAALAHGQGDRDAVSAHLAKAHALFKAVRTPRWVERTEQLAREFGVSLAASGDASGSTAEEST